MHSIFALLLAAVAAPSLAQDSEPLRVVTTIGVLADLVREIGGDRVEVSVLSRPDQDLHYLQARPTLMKAARSADLFIQVGMELEPWAALVIDGAGNPAIQVGQPGHLIASTGVTALERPTVLSRELGDVHPFGNPHVWLDPIQLLTMSRNVEVALVRLAPDAADACRERGKAFRTRLLRRLYGQSLLEQFGEDKVLRLVHQDKFLAYLDHKGLRGELGGWMQQAAGLRGKSIVTFHRTFSYLAHRFGLEVPITLEEVPGISPSARHRDAVIARMKEQRIDTIVLAPYYPLDVARSIAEHAGARLIQLPIDLQPDQGIRTCFDLFDYLLARLDGADGTGTADRE
jgi:zinc/manganese transport system substrate-binding protein